MVHLPHLIRDLALILMTAGAVTVLFRLIKQPVVLGYIIAGFLVGPNVSLVPTVSDLPSIQIWAEIGVIFLLFALGLEFSFKKLLSVGGSATLAAMVEVLSMTVLGYLAGYAFGWSSINCLFLGGILAISSTTIIIRAIEETGLKQRGFVSLVFGILIVEDLLAILLLVVLTTIAQSQEIEGWELFIPLAKLGFFLVLWFLAGVFVLPTLLRLIRRHTSEETTLIVAAGLCFAMVVMTSAVGFSPALGAFFMGAILAETNDAERIAHLVRPVKDLFGAVFFVSVGMLINPELLARHLLPIAALTALTIFGKFTTTLAGTLLAGRSLRHSVQAGMSLAQIGEFSFIIAGLGMNLKVTGDFLYPIAVGVSALTTFATPYMIRNADHVYGFIQKHLSPMVLKNLNRYEVSAHRLSTRRERMLVLRAYAVTIITNGVLIVAIFVALANLRSGLIGLGAATVVATPFFWALVVRRIDAPGIAGLWLNKENRPGLILLEATRVLSGVALYGALATQFIRLELAVVITGLLLVAFVWSFTRHLGRFHRWLEARFLENLSERETLERAKSAVPPLAPWDAHLANFEVPTHSEIIGKTLEELKVRESFGVTIVLIERGGVFLTAPGRSARLFPADKVSIVGTDEQIHAFAEFIKPPAHEHAVHRFEDYALYPLEVNAAMPFCGRSIRESGIREQTDGLVVGIERAGQRILNPDSQLTIEPGDLLWIVGDRKKYAAQFS